jgi:catechol 2,3-dioxygenase-like lactoylglutathione lyase family enzyme
MSGPALTAQDANVSLTCNDVQKSIRFYTEGLGFEIVHKMENDGKIQFVAMRAGAAQIGLGQDDFAKGKDRAKGVGLRIWLNTTQDITALAGRATGAGLKLDEGPAKLPWGPMAFAVTDPDGFKLTVSNPMTP